MNFKIGLALTLALGFVVYLLFSGGFIYRHLVLFSSVNGVVRANGLPLEGIKVTRMTRFTFNDETIEDFATTDSKGQFSFPEIKRTMLLMLPHEPVILQDIRIDDANLAATYGREFSVSPKERKQVINLWMFYKRDYDSNSEYKDQVPKTIICDLEAQIGSLFSEDPKKSWIEAPKGKCRIID